MPEDRGEGQLQIKAAGLGNEAEGMRWRSTALRWQQKGPSESISSLDGLQKRVRIGGKLQKVLPAWVTYGHRGRKEGS